MAAVLAWGFLFGCRLLPVWSACQGSCVGRAPPRVLLQKERAIFRSAIQHAREPLSAQLPEEHERSLARFLASLDRGRLVEADVMQMYENSTSLEADEDPIDIELPTLSLVVDGKQDQQAAGLRGTGIDTPWTQSFRAGYHDGSRNYVGGSEITHLAAFAGKLWASNGYWMDKLKGMPAQVLRLDSPDATWQVDLDTAKHADLNAVPGAQYSYCLRVTTLKELAFTKDKDGRDIARKSLLLAAAMAYLSTGTTAASVFVRDGASGTWKNRHLLVGNHRQEPRDVEVFENPVTGKQRVFLLAGELGVLSGAYDAQREEIMWDSAPERISSGTLSSRALGLTQVHGMLFFSDGASIYLRSNEDDASWSQVFSLAGGSVNAEMGGMRGLSALPSEDSLLLCWAPDEESTGNIIRVDEQNAHAGGHDETSLQALYKRYMADVPEADNPIQNLGCYNEFYPIVDPATDETVHVTGFETLLSGASYTLSWNQYYAGGTYVIRRNSSSYEVHEVNRRYQAGNPIPLAPRAFISSPFPGEEQVLYVGGFDSNWLNVHNTAWIFKGGYNEVFGRATVTTTTTTPLTPACQLCPHSTFKANTVAGFTNPPHAYSAYTCKEVQTHFSVLGSPSECSSAVHRFSSVCCSCLLCPGKTLKADAVAGYTGGRPYTCASTEAWINSETATMTCRDASRHWDPQCCE